jgi:hypothetical protein
MLLTLMIFHTGLYRVSRPRRRQTHNKNISPLWCSVMSPMGFNPLDVGDIPPQVLALDAAVQGFKAQKKAHTQPKHLSFVVFCSVSNGV